MPHPDSWTRNARCLPLCLTERRPAGCGLHMTARLPRPPGRAHLHTPVAAFGQCFSSSVKSHSNAGSSQSPPTGAFLTGRCVAPSSVSPCSRSLHCLHYLKNSLPAIELRCLGNSAQHQDLQLPTEKCQLLFEDVASLFVVFLRQRWP